MSTKDGLRYILDDVVRISTVGVPALNAEGEEIVIYTDFTCKVADYHECTVVLDVTGQNGKAPCHFCSFLRFGGHGTVASRYGFTTDVHSADSCYARSAPRTDVLRSGTFSDEDLISMGFSKESDADMKNRPLEYFHNELAKALRNCSIPLTEDNRPAVNPQFDPYRSMVVVLHLTIY